MIAALALAATTALAQPDVRTVRLPADAHQPRAAVAPDGSEFVVFLTGRPKAADVKLTRFDPATGECSAPVPAADRPALMAGTMRGPQIALGRDGWIHIAFNGTPAHDTDHTHPQAPVLYTRSRDGVHFEPTRNLMQRSNTLDGGCAVAADSLGNVHVVWHALPNDAHHHDEAHRTVFVATSNDDGRSFAPEAPASDDPLGACGCCGLAAACTTDNRLLIFYRTATNGTERGMHLLAARSPAPFLRSPVDDWSIQICPASSALINPAGTNPLLAWEHNDSVYWAWADDPHRHAAESSNRRAKHPAVAATASAVLLAWAQGGGRGARADLAWQLFSHDGRPLAPPSTLPDALPPYSFPAVVPHADDFIILY